ncbi:transferase family protein [Grosmannia clavigera kw1407]|uniref:Transferase family protein n=1 Tax=Grosmannia clavigera (strain kw1407 / UAMH 11150) TaxID=655863 RepID=F0XU55_GROCL|nr:transferase family protein [Grosmannia clavigera kw1407]EFW99055.1 transferase family protein [Grosmannia clavigera kw1407]
MSSPEEISDLKRERVHPQTPSPDEQTMLLSILDATTANFALTNAIWLFERPKGMDVSDVPGHLRRTLSTTLDSYPQWAQRDFQPMAADSEGCISGCGGSAEVGVDFATAASSLTLDSLYSSERTKTQPLWNCKDNGIARFINTCDIAHALQPNNLDAKTGIRKPIMGIQCTMLACGGFVLAVKIAHPLADISGLVYFVSDWARVSQAIVTGSTLPVLSPVFEPARLDEVAASDINSHQPDPAIVKKTKALLLHRYDWWAPPGKPPAPFLDEADSLTPSGQPMPWEEWDVKAPVSGYTIHLTKEQVELLWKDATTGAEKGGLVISKHDAVLAHMYACIMRARRLQIDEGPVHCDLVLGLRSALKLGESFMGSPIIMINVEMSGTEACLTECLTEGKPTGLLAPIAKKVRETIVTTSNRDNLSAHLHTVAFEKSPQRLWQAFLGQRHILVTTWARAGLYDVDFGLGSDIRYADGLMPSLDGVVFIKEAPPSSGGFVSASRPSWTSDGVDIGINIKTEDMERLLKDPLLLPSCP